MPVPTFDKIPFAGQTTTNHVNGAIGAINAVSPLTGAGGAKVTMSGAGATIYAPPATGWKQPYIGKVVKNGPNGEADYDDGDPRYWVQTVIPAAGDTLDEQPDFNVQTSDGSGSMNLIIRTVTNMAEVNPLGSQPLPPDTYVRVFRHIDSGKEMLVMHESVAGFIPLSVSQSGGTNGSASTTPSYTYNCTNAVSSSVINGGPYSPQWARTVGPVSPATHGTGYYDGSGSFHLLQVDEVPETTNCSSGTLGAMGTSAVWGEWQHQHPQQQQVINTTLKSLGYADYSGYKIQGY